MLKAQPRLAQDARENKLPCPQGQSREAGSCLGSFWPLVGLIAKGLGTRFGEKVSAKQLRKLAHAG